MLPYPEVHEYRAVSQLFAQCPLDVFSPDDYATQASLLRARPGGITLEIPPRISVQVQTRYFS